MGLEEIRKELDTIDREIVQLFQKRMDLSIEVAKDKAKTGKAVFDGKREEEKLNSISDMVGDPLLKTPARELFRGLMTLSRRRQLQYLSEIGRKSDFSFREVGELSFSGKKLVAQGVKWSYSYLAGRAFFQEDSIEFVEHFQDVLEAVQAGRADYGILPMDNSTYGMVQDNYDLLSRYEELSVLKEINYPVSHCLCSAGDYRTEEIRKVYSHPQALAQCREFFKEYPFMEKIADLNTAIAAKKLAETKEEYAAVLCSRPAAEYYGLRILQDGVSSKENTTRFFLIGKEKVYTKDADKLTMILWAANQAGSLYHVLGDFTWNGLSLSMIQSRPVGDKAFSYLFFVDVSGNLSEPEMENALSALKEEGVQFRILGNYLPCKVKNS